MNKISFYINSEDGKSFNETVDEVYFTSLKTGDRAILPGSQDLSCLVGISRMFFKKNNEITYISTSGGVMSFYDNKAIFLVETYELSNEINKERALNAKMNAECILKDSTLNSEELKKAEVSLKKAINRLSALK